MVLKKTKKEDQPENQQAVSRSKGTPWENLASNVPGIEPGEKIESTIEPGQEVETNIESDEFVETSEFGLVSIEELGKALIDLKVTLDQSITHEYMRMFLSMRSGEYINPTGASSTDLVKWAIQQTKNTIDLVQKSDLIE